MTAAGTQRLVLGGLLLTSCSYGCEAVGHAEGRMPQGVRQVDVALARIGPDLYSLKEEALSKAKREILEVDFHGLRLRAPDRGVASARAELPILYARRATGQRDWEVTPQRNTLLLASDLVQGHVRLGWAFQSRKRADLRSLPRSKEGPQPDEVERSSVSVQIQPLDAYQLSGQLRDAGRCAFTLLSWDWVSNTVTVEIADGARPAAKPEPLSAQRAHLLLKAWKETGGTSASLPAQGVDGVIASVPAEIQGGGAVVVKGELRMPVPGGMIVKEAAVDGEAGAFLPLGVALLKKDEIEPPLLYAAVPVTASAGLLRGEQAGVRFSVDLGKLARRSLSPGEYLVYLASGTFISGPHRLLVKLRDGSHPD